MGTRVISAALTLKDKDFSSNLKRAAERTDDFGRGIALVGNKINRFKDNTVNSFKTITRAAGAVSFAAIGVGAASLATAVGSSVLQMEESFAMLSAKTGATGEELKNLESVAKNVFKAGFGESIGMVTDDVALLNNMFKGVGEDELTSIATNTSTISKIMGAETREVGRAIKGMVENFDNLSTTDAADLITKAFQKTGDYSDDLLDTFNEYSMHFSKLGLSGEEFAGILSNASGAFQIDKVGDAVKEFGIRAIDGSKLTAEGFAAIGMNADEMGGKIAEGGETANNAFVATLAGLASIEDSQERNAAGAALFGTQWEDVRDDVVLSMTEGKDSMTGFEGATKKAADTITGTFGSRVSQVWRDLQVSLADIAKEKGASELLDSMAGAAEKLVPKILDVVDGAVDFANTIKDNWGVIKEVLIGVAAGAAVLLTAFTAFKIVAGITALYKGLRTALMLASAGQWAMNTAMLASPITWVVLGIGAVVAAAVLLYRNWNKVKDGWETVWGKIKSSAGSGVNFVIDQINKLIGVINKIPGVNVPIVAKVDWGQATQHAKTNVNVASPTKVDKTYGVSAKPKKTVTSGIDKSYGLVKGSYAVGADRLTEDHIAQVHKDEMIIPARQAEKVRRAGYNINNIGNIGQPTQSNNNNITININGTGASSDQIINELVPKLKLAIANI